MHITFPYYDPSYGEIRTTEGRSRKIGSYVGAAITNHINVVASSSEAWRLAQSWAPLDSEEYALEINGESFALACAADIVVDEPAVDEIKEATKAKTVRSRVLVSPSSLSWPGQSEYLSNLLQN